MKTKLLFILALFLVPVGQLAAQIYPAVNILNSSGEDTTIVYTNQDYLSTSPSADSSLDLGFTINQPALTLKYSQISANLVIPQLSYTQDYTTGFSTVVPITTTLNFNPVQFTINPTSSETLTPGIGYSQPTYVISNTTFSFSIPNITGSYTVTSPSAFNSGTFSIPVSGLLALQLANLQTGSYPNSVNIDFTTNGSYVLIQPGSGAPTLFTTSISGATVSASGFDFTENINNQITTFNLAGTPEPSTWALMLGGLGLLAFWRLRTRRTVS